MQKFIFFHSMKKSYRKKKKNKLRFFILFPHLILYFKEVNDLSHPAGVIFLQGAQVTENIEMSPAGPKKKATELLITTPARDYHILAESEEQKKTWLTETQNAIDGLSSKKDDKIKKEKFLLENSLSTSKHVIEEIAKILNNLSLSDRTGDEGFFLFFFQKHKNLKKKNKS